MVKKWMDCKQQTLVAVGEANFGGLILNYDEWTTTSYDVQRDYSEVTARVVLRVLWLVVATGHNEKKASNK